MMSEEKLSDDLEKDISGRFMFLWDQYNKLINLLITLSTGTIVLLFNSLVNNEKSLTNETRPIITTILVMLLLGLISAIAWRSFTQTTMSKEVLGNKNNVKEYLKISKVNGITSLYEDHSENWLVPVWKWSHGLTLIFLLSGWTSLALFYAFRICGETSYYLFYVIVSFIYLVIIVIYLFSHIKRKRCKKLNENAANHCEQKTLEPADI